MNTSQPRRRSVRTPEQEMRRYKAALRLIAGLPDHENHWSIARLFCDLVLERPDLSIPAAHREAIREMDQTHQMGDYS